MYVVDIVVIFMFLTLPARFVKNLTTSDKDIIQCFF